MDLINAPSSKGPSKVILVTSAICLSVILASISYKITLSQKNSLLKENNSIIGTAVKEKTSEDIISEAIIESEAATLAQNDSDDSNPFAIKSEDSVSDRVSKKLFSGFLYAEQTDGITDDSLGQVSDVVLSQITQKDLPAPVFSINQAKTFTPTSKEEIKMYGNNIAGVILAYYQQINNNPGYKNDLPGLAKIFKSIGYSLMDQKVPANLIREHTSLANSYILSGEGMEMVADEQKDPVRALLGVKTLKEVGESQAEVLIRMGIYFRNNDIIFEKGEAGVLWNQYLNLSTNEQNAKN